MNDEYDHYRYSSIMDVISILDSASLTGNELVPQYRAMQIANRALIAHHSMEKGFKDRLKKEGLTYPTSGSQGHDLSVLYQLTHQINQGTWAQSLAESYNDAVTFYEYDIQALPHLATLDTYLNKVGSNQMFTQMRYWLEDQTLSTNGVESILHISLLLHREILQAIWPLVAFDQQRFVSQRVDQILRMELQRACTHSPGTPSEQSSKLIIQWLQTHPDFRTAMREAVQKDFHIEEIDEGGKRKLREAFQRLYTPDENQFIPSPPPSADPAIAFFIGTGRDIRPGSQNKYPDVGVEIKWLNPQYTFAEISTPAGEVLGFIEKHAQSRWHVETIWNNYGAFSKDFDDALQWIITYHCKRISITANGQTMQRYIFSIDNFLPIPVSSGRMTEMGEPQMYEINFWSDDHNLQLGQQVAITMKWDEESSVVDRLEGKVSYIEDGKVRILGNQVFDVVN